MTELRDVHSGVNMHGPTRVTMVSRYIEPHSMHEIPRGDTVDLTVSVSWVTGAIRLRVCVYVASCCQTGLVT